VEQVVFNQSMKVLERLMAHEKKMNDFMSIKCNDRSEFKLEEAGRLERGSVRLFVLFVYLQGGSKSKLLILSKYVNKTKMIGGT